MEILKPGRYINSEWNSVHKEWKEDALKIALCFPDIYEIGMSHLGMRIIYGLLNREDGVICERFFAPWSDMEAKMRSEKIELFSLESKKVLNEFDIVGFSLQYEMNFVDVLNLLELGGIPVRSSERGNADPLVIAGGPCCFNPEPMADFIDAFVIGEAEEVVLEIVRLAQGCRLKAQGSRDRFLKDLSEIDGIYVPAFNLEPSAFTLKKRIIKDLDNSYFPTAPIVPYIQIVHDRVSLEIMRGCPHKCKFCQARNIFYPFRTRSVKTLLEIAERSIGNTGYEEISLLSLSTSDYPYLEELVEKMEERLNGLGVKISLPSIRAQSFKGSKLANVVKRTGLTFAPEAGSDSLRIKIGKEMSNEEIIQKSRLAFEHGWRKVKLYFMLGLPGETREDLDAIVDLASEIKGVSLSISPFIPKPHSEFENEPMEKLDILREKIRYLGSRLTSVRGRALGLPRCRASLYRASPSGPSPKRSGPSGRGRCEANREIKIDFHAPEMSRVEAVLARGDRGLGNVIQKVWEKGARLEAWGEHFDYNLWMQCFDESGIDPEDYLKKKPDRESLPWSFIHSRPAKSRAKRGENRTLQGADE